LTDLYSGYDAVERHKIIHRIDETVAQIYDLKDRVANLAKAISEAYGESIVIFDKLSNLKLFFAQLLGHKLSSGNTPIENLEIYKRNLSTIDTLYEKLSADYSGNKEVVENEIEHLQEEVALIVQTYALDKTLKVYAERLIFFTNKYRNEAAEIKQFLNLAEAFYKKGEYSNTVNLLIDTLSLIKESAEGSKIAFN
jgi:septation ring formation regulator EzrA